MLLAASQVDSSASQTSLNLVPSASPKTGQFTLKLQVQSVSNSVIYVIQTSTNLVNWNTVVSGKTQPGALLQLANVSPTNQAAFFRVNELPVNFVDTNPPAWTNGVGGQFTLMPPSGATLTWNPATDNVGVAQYSIYVNGVLVTNIPGSTLSYQLTLNYSATTDIRIQASDASSNTSPILSLIYFPGSEIAAISDDGGHVYVLKYQVTNSIVTNGGFTAPNLVTNFGSNDRGLVLGDFDHDGILDLIAAYANGNAVNAYFFKGKGDGTFAAPVPLPNASGAQQGGYVMDMAVGDFDGDGNLDVAINGNGPIVVIYWGNGDGTFTPSVQNWGDGNYADGRGMVAGDFNEDGLDDIARATCCNGMIKVFLSNGDRTFIQTNLIASGLADNDPYALATGDFTGDGHLDLLVAGGGSGDVSYLKGLGNGSFVDIGTNGLWTNLDIGTYGGWKAYDYNGDGNPDIVMGAYNGQAYFWTGNGDGTFSSNRVTIATGLNSALGVAVAPRPPRVDINIVPQSPVTNINSTITFTAVGAGVSTNDVFRWSFGDAETNPVAWQFSASSTNMGPTVSHYYSKEGRFLTRLWHTTYNGTNSVRGTWAIVKGQPPVANPGGPYVFGSQVATDGVWYATVDGSGSTDDFGIVSYVWNFGDGNSWTTNTPTAFHGWPSNGVYTVSLTVYDAAGQSDTKTTTITFTNGAPPVASITGPPVLDEDYALNGTWTATYYATNSSGPVGIWLYAWKNLTTGQTGTGPSFQTTWTAVGTNYVMLTVTGNDSQTNSTSEVVAVIGNGPPVPVIQGPQLLSVDVATNGLWFGAWNGTNSTDYKGIYIYAWNFGDGATASGPSVTHNYTAAGVYSLTLKVTDDANQTATATQTVIVVAGNPPVAKITASTLAPEGDEPISFSADSSTSDHGIYLYTWFLPPRQFDFFGQYLDSSQWASTYTVQNNKLTVTGQNAWGVSYFFSTHTLLQRLCTFQGQVDTPSTPGTAAMVGLKNLNVTSGSYGYYPYAIYFDNGTVHVYNDGSDFGTVTNYLPGTAYDFDIVTKPGAGAYFYLRPSGTGQPFALICNCPYEYDTSFSFGADVYEGVWSFENFEVSNVVASGSELTTPVYPGGTVTLQVVDNALLTNSTSVVVTPVVGEPPVAVISGPTNGQSGLQLAFDGYGSSDDYAIASYTWNFGDGSPPAFGPGVTHSYGQPGVYTNTLTVADYAEQTSSASLVVTVTGSNVVVHVPWLIINGLEQPHPIYAGKTNTLKAVARGIPVPFTYIWNYGDGTGSVTNTVTNSAPVYNLGAPHAYFGGDGTPYYAQISVILTNGTTYQDIYPLLVSTKSLTIEEEVAIDEGLWHLQNTQTLYNVDTNTPGGYWSSIGTISATASSVQAFAVNGHLMTDDPTKDPYVDTVQRGVNYLLNNLLTEPIGPETYGDPDLENNGIGLQVNSSYPIYEGGPVIDAFVATAQPQLIATTGGINVKGRAFKDIVQDMMDMFMWGQCQDPVLGGGWRYAWQQGPDNSASQWGAIGMLAGQNYWGCLVPDWIKQRNLIWVNYSMDSYGFGYTGPGAGGGLGLAGEDACTPSALVQATFDGIPNTNALWLHGEGYLANNWSSLMGNNNLYANYSITKAMRTAIPQPVQTFTNGFDWFNDPVVGLARVTIDHQAADGSWVSSVRVDEPLASAWSILILSSTLFQQGPVGVITVKPNPSAIGYPVVFDASGSYDKNPADKIVQYRWIFNSTNGSDFSHPDAVGPVVTNVYGSISTNTVLLQVTDNNTPPLSGTASVIIQTTVPPYPPTADAGGPYVACAGESIQLDGSGSFCVDASAGNFIQSYEWEVNYEVPLTFNQGVSGVQAVFTNGYPVGGTYTIGLQVENANSIVYSNFSLPNETADAFTTAYIYNRVISDLKVRPKATKAQLTWTKVGDYAVIMRSSQGPNNGYVQVGQTSSSYATYLDTTVAYNTDYYYRVFAYNNGQTAPLGISDPVFIHSAPRTFDEHAPQFESTPLRLAKVGELYEVTLDAVSLENEPMYYSLLIGPTNMTVNPTTGVVDFTPTTNQIGNNALSFQVTNSVGRDVLSYTLFVFPPTNHSPVVKVNGPYNALTGQNIQLSSAGTYDPDNNPLLYYWDLGDGSTSTNPNPVHAYGGVGSYLITLYVNDGYGNTVSAQTTAQITRPDVPPVAVVSNGPNFMVRLGEAITLNGSESYSPLGNPITYGWIFGDGSVSNNAPAVLSHLYSNGGPYTGSLIVTDNKGESNTANFTVTIEPANQAPIVTFTYSPTNPYVQGVVTFDATGTTDPAGDPVSYTWDFGDHSKTTGSLVTHVFQQITNFTVTLTVADTVDTNNGTSTASQTVTVVDAPPVFTSSPQLLTRAGSNYVYVPTVTDAAGSACTFQLIQGPATMTCDPASGTLSWLPGTNDMGPNPIDLRATDAYGGSSDQIYTLVVSTPEGPQIDLQPTHMELTNVFVDSQTLAYSGSVLVDLTNNGPDSVPVPFTVSIFVASNFNGTFDTNSDYVVGYGIISPGFPGYGSGYVEIGVYGTALFNGCPLYAFVDSQDVVPEYNKLNNIMRSGSDESTNTPPVIDLSASYLQVGRFGLPTNVVLTARLGNCGLVTVPTNVPIAFYDGDPTAGGTLIGVAWSTNTMDPGQFEDLSINWSSPTITEHTIYINADDPGNGVYQFQEITYSNNLFSVLEDLSAILPPVANAGPNQNVNVGDTVTLNGRDSFDPQGRSLTYSWSAFTPPIGSLAQLSGTNTVSPSFVADVAGLYSAQLVVNDGIVSSTNPATVYIAAIDTNTYYPPTITSTPSFQGIVSVPYTYAVTATDPQNMPLKYRLPQAPAGMTINTNTGLVQWTPASSGSFFVQVAADGVGGSFYQGYTLTVIPFANLPPQFTSTPVTTAAPNAVYAYTATAVSPDDYTVTYSLTQAPSGMTINGSSGAITWTPSNSQLGGHPIIITANDGHGETATQNYNLVVSKFSSNGPVVQPIPDQTVTAPTAFTAFSLDNYVFDPNYSPSQITWTATGTNLLSVSIDSNRVATVSYPSGANIDEQITFLATDPAGNSGYSTPTFTVIGNATPPVAAIANLSTTTTTAITNGSLQLFGTADEPGAPASIQIAWQIGLYDENGNLVANVTPGPLDANGYHDGRVPAGGSFGNLDFTLVRNGDYTLVLQVTDGTTTANASAQVALDANYNIGQLKFSQEDVVLPVQGVGLQILRNYDSLNTTVGDFGYGWTYSVSDLGVSVDDQRVEAQDLDGENFSQRVGGSWDVTLTMPDTGRRVTFTFNLAQGDYTAQAYWTPPPGVNATLVPTCSATLETIFTLPPFWQAAGEGSDWEAFDWPGFILTTKDGTQYEIDRVDGGEHDYITDSGLGGTTEVYTGGYLARITGTGGQYTIFAHDGNGTLQNITQYSAMGQQQRSILFQRDSQNRIDAIYLPSDLDSNGVPDGPATMTYGYDDNDNLITASTLMDDSNPTNLAYSTRTYVYGNPLYPHYITQIIDPRGVSAMQSEFDSSGRLVGIVDAQGKVTTIQNNLAAQTETVYDSLGNPTLFGYDSRGNVVIQVDALGDITQYIHDINNNIIMQIDPLGNTNSYTYDAMNNQLTHTDPLGNTTVNTYDSDSRLLTTTDPLGHTTVNTYDANGNLTNVVDAAGNVTSYTYDVNNNKISMTDPLGNVTLYSYDSMGDLISQTDPTGNVTTYGYDINGYQIAETNVVSIGGGAFRTNVTTTTYNTQGAPTSTTDGAGHTTLREYDPVGNPSVTVDPLGNTNTFAFDVQNHLVATVYADGTSNSYAYDADGRRISWTDRDGRATYYAYDALGRLTNTYYPRNANGPLPTVQLQYNAAGQTIAQIDELGNTTTYAYDADGRQIAVTNALGYVTTTAYDADGNVISTTDGLGHSTFYQYDALNRLVRTIYADGTSKKTAYDADGRDIADTDQNGATTSYQYDGLGELTAVINPLGQKTQYAYDQDGALSQQTDANGHTTQIVNDPVAYTRTTTLPSGQVSTIVFNGADNPSAITNDNGQVIRYSYDVNNLLTLEQFPDGSTVSFTYTPTGRRQTMTDSRGTTAFAYDARDHLISQTDPSGRSIQYTYDLAGNRTQLITFDPQSSLYSTQAFTYDALNRLQTVTDPQGGVTTYSYDAANDLLSAQLPDGSVRSNAYDTVSQLTQLKDWSSTNLIASYQYSLSAAGDPLSVNELGGRQVGYTYDSNRQLLGETVASNPAGNNWTNSYSYDPVGNRFDFGSLAASPGESGYLYDSNDEVLAETNLVNGDITRYTYDQNGNTLSRSNSLGTAYYTWTPDDRLTGATINDSNGLHQLAYQYNPDGIRVGATIIQGGQTNQISYLVDGNVPNAQVIGEWSSLNGQPASPSAAYTYGLGLISQYRSGIMSYYHPDNLGSTRLLTSAGGKVTDTYNYDAYGQVTDETGTTPNNYLFAGQERDFNLGLDYLRARYMSPELGRFYGRDPGPGDTMDPASLHPYIYARNNPVTYVDPTGQQFDLVTISVTLSINTTIDQYQISLARFGLQGIQQSTKIINDVINPGIQLQQIGLQMMIDGDNRGNDMFNLGVTLEQTGYSLLQSAISGIYVNTFNSAQATIAIGPLTIELSLVKGSATWTGSNGKKTTLGTYGVQDYNGDLQKILANITTILNAIPDGPKGDPQLDQGADQLQKNGEDLLKKLGLDGSPSSYKYTNKK